MSMLYALSCYRYEVSMSVFPGKTMVGGNMLYNIGFILQVAV